MEKSTKKHWKKFSNIQEIQERLFEILVFFSEFCKENQITYFLAYGTCLGAHRHKGFIPWDDDIDVLVPRDDYEKIHDFARSKRNFGNFKFEFYDTEEKYYYPFCKLVNTSTQLRERVFNPWPMGLFIDIFPLDYVPSNSLDNNIRIWRLNFNSILLNSTIWKARGDEPIFIRFLFQIGTILPKILCFPIRKICPKRIDKLAIEINHNAGNNELMSDVEWTVGLKKIVYKAADLFPPRKLSFNGREFYVPSNYTSLLAQWYGNYMKLPPEESRIPHLEEAYYYET